MAKIQLPKMLKKLHLNLLLLCSLIGFGSYAQTYPIVVSTQITQPSPIYLRNYADATTINSPIKVQLVLNDLTISNRQVKLKIYFQGNGISFTTNDFIVGARPLYLEGGFPLQLTNVDLAPYFEYQNLLGLNQNQYAQPLPEGVYNIYVEVYDFATGKKLSKKTGSTTIIFQNEPPFLNLPLNNASIMQQNIQNIIFSWTPRSINVSNVEYEFSLVEIWDQYTPVQNAFAYSPPLYTTTIRNTTFQYGINELQLIPGKKYAWRIKAKAILGAEEIGVFKNNGYSEIYSFTYEVFCTSPLAIKTDGISQDQAKISWSGNIDNYDYQINYREKNADSEWYKLVTPRENLTISNLKPNTVYEYTVGASCDVGKYTHSSVKEFTTLAKDEITFQGCGIKPDPNDLANKTPLPELFPNDVVTAGDFPIVVLHSTGSNGTFTGDGYVTLPFLEKFRKLIDAADALGGEKINIGQFSRIRITFKNIGVNTDFKLISGEIIASYDPDWKNIADLDGVVNDAFGDAGNVVNHQYDLSIKSVVKNPDGSITVTSTTGVTSVLEKTVNDIVITDKDGKQFAVPANAPAGNIKQTGQLAPGGIPTSKNTNGMGSGGDVTEISSPDVNVVFSKGDGKYAFDTAPIAENGSLNKTYQTIPKKGGGTYKVNYKAISDNPNTDVVVATVDFKNGKTKKDLVFKTQNGTAIDSTQIAWKDNVATLTLKKTLDFAKETIIATVKPATPKDPKEVAGKYDIAGTIDLWHLTNKKVNVTLVSVNNAKIPNDAQSQLNAIYEPAGVTFNVNAVNVTLDNTWGESIETSESGLLATYTSEQQLITTNLKQKLGSDYKKDTYYIIYTDAPASKSNILGFMPLKRQYGFIFNKTNIVRTLAHELGHGVFGLQHPFTEYNTSTTTDLLMDYGTGVTLSHNDWQVLHAPGLQLYPFIQGDSDGEYKTWSKLIGTIVENIPGYENQIKSFVSLTGETISLPKDARDFGFLNGYLVGFTIGEERWTAFVTKPDDKIFKGYYKDAVEGANGYDFTGKVPYSMKSEGDQVFFGQKASSDCSSYTIYSGTLKSSTITNGGIDKETIHVTKSINQLAGLTEVKLITTVSNKINCLKGRAQEFYKFVLEHYQSNNITITEIEKDELADHILAYKNVFINKLDGDANSIAFKQIINFREMLKYGHKDLIAKLKGVSEWNLNEVTLVINLEDYERIKDEYLLYKYINEEFDTDCTIAENLRQKIQKDGDEIKLDLELLSALSKDTYELISGNEAIELLSCLLKNLKVPESYYNPNRIDNVQNKVFDYLFERAGVNPQSLAALIPKDLYNYPNACGCGIWNSIVDLALGITTLADGLTTNPSDINKFLNETYRGISEENAFSKIGTDLWTTLKEHHGYVDGYGLDGYQTTYATCYDVVFVLSFYVGVGEIKALSTAAELSDVAKIIANVIKSAPSKTVATITALKNVIPAMAKFGNNITRKIVLGIIERVPDDILKVLPDGAKIRIVNAQLNQNILEFSKEGLKIIAPIGSGSNQVNHIIYESNEVITDMVSGKTGILKIGTDDAGNIVAWIFSSNTETGILARIENLGYKKLADEITKLTTDLKSKFLSDFEVATSAVFKSLNDDIELFEVWKKWNDKGIKSIEELGAFKRVWKLKVRNVTFEEFYIKTASQIKNANGNKFAPEIYEAWTKGKGHENDLKTVYRKFGLDPAKEYPPCEGVWGVDQRKAPSIDEILDRFQTREGLGGGYAGVVPPNSSYTISSRALMENYSVLVEEGKEYFYYKFKMKSVPSSLVFEYGEAIPWFDELGGAIQVKTSNSFQNLSKEIEILETWKMKNGIWKKVINFIEFDLPATMKHVKFRDLEVARKNGIGGCHDAVEFSKIRQASETGYIVPIDKTLDEVPEIIISNITNSTTPGIKIVEYKIPAIDAKLKTTGLLKGDGAKNFKKAIYDPAIWSDDKLEKALKEVLEDAINKNDGKLPDGNPSEGVTSEGYKIMFTSKNEKITSFWFD